MTTFKDALKNRRSYYALTDKSTISDEEIEQLLDFSVLNVPSAFNSQSTRIVLLLGDAHKKLWNLTKDELKKIVPENAFAATQQKIDSCFASGYGTVLFYEDQDVVKGLQNSFPLYSANFPVWSSQTSAMHQLAVWTMLKDAGMGANLQHYNPLIDNSIAAAWNIKASWTLIAQMPFGVSFQEPAIKEFAPLSERIKVYKQ